MSDQMQSQWNSSWLDSGNQSYLENQFETFLKDPESLSDEWRAYFQNLISTNKQYMDVSHADVRAFFKNLSYKPKVTQTAGITQTTTNSAQAAVEKLIFSYRLLGHLQSNINPLKEKPQPRPELQIANFGLDQTQLDQTFTVDNLAGPKSRTLAKIIDDLNKIYCGNIACEFLHIDNYEERTWIRETFEHTMLNATIDRETQAQLLDLVIAADGLEKYLGSKYPGVKRFSLEGCDTVLVGLDQIISCASTNGVQEIIICMSHRGRLNVLVNLLGKLPSELFDQFEERHNVKLESGDVKYHQGFSTDLQTATGNIHANLVFNPSHLEIVTPVAVGSTRARQDRRGKHGKEQVLCVALHGDAAFAGQGIAMEILNMAQTRGYEIGGTIHVIVNNQIGFTTSNPHDARSTRYCSDLGKMLSIPIFHVNADDPEAIWLVFQIATAFKLKFQRDVIIDVVGYRRMGHNEADEPSATQPMMYKKIRNHPCVKDLYAQNLIANYGFSEQEVAQKVNAYRESLDKRDHAVARRMAAKDWKNAYASDWSPYVSRDWRIPTVTAVALETLQSLANLRDTVPEGFVLDKRVAKIVESRQQMTQGIIALDWGYAETLAYATLLNEGYGVRLAGQDSARGTFFHRHAVWHDQNNGETYASLCNLSKNQGKFSIIDSLLSEAGALGFEYGYSTSEPRTLTLWEAQFGDFANSAQVVTDQFISSGEQKWGRLSGLVLLLPHGYEGQGPEHSSARIERYLQLCAQYNIQVCIPSTPKQMFHLLRRQILRPMRKPLVVITPKSLLRNKEAVSTLDELANGSFLPIIGDNNPDFDKINRVIICSGKIYYELVAARANNSKIAILRMEQLYPFPEEELAEELKKYHFANTVVWCQEEPRNQGAWYSTQHHVRNVLLPHQYLQYAGRSDSAAPAVGYYYLHEQQQQELLQEAIGEN